MQRFGPVLVLLLAFTVRVVGLDVVPPGWRDDEVIETTVHAQRVLNGEWPIYFVEAEGHEPLYHYASAGWIALVGRSLAMVRVLSAFFGLLTVAAAYRLARQLFGPQVATLAALLLAVSFWALMFSRVKLRHIGALAFVLLAFSSWWRTVRRPNATSLLVSGVFLGLGLNTYFAALTAPLILTAASCWLGLMRRLSLRRTIAAALVPSGLALLLYVPLLVSIRSSAGGAERLRVVGAPLAALAAGNPRPVLENTGHTLAMFVWRGDPEALYNLPGRPVFGPVGFAALLIGSGLALGRLRDPRYAFLVLWLAGGLSPGFLSHPAASLGHTIVAQPAVYLLAALPAVATSRWLANTAHAADARGVMIGLSGLLVLTLGVRDLRSYFVVWPRDPYVRLLYKAGLHEYLASDDARGELSDRPLAIASTLSLWDVRAFELDTAGRYQARWFRSATAFIYPLGERPLVVAYLPHPSDSPLLQDVAPRQILAPEARVPAAYAVGLALEGYTLRTNTPARLQLYLFWQVTEGYVPPPPLIGPSPKSPAQPFNVFVHLRDAQDNRLAGADGFDVDTFTLRPGDRWIQLHDLALPPNLPAGGYRVVAGLYDPTTGARFVTSDGRESIALTTLPIAEP